MWSEKLNRLLNITVLKGFAYLLMGSMWGGGILGSDVKDEDARDERLFYTVERNAKVFKDADSSQVSFQLKFRESIDLIERQGRWSLVEREDGSVGYVASSAISNIWIRISKRKKSVYVYRGTQLIKRYVADFGNNVVSDKIQRGNLRSPDDWRTPEGTFFVVSKNPNSKFYKALVLNYPNAEDARRGFRQGLISQREYQAIVKAEENASIPPMNTMLGGWIEIHGDGTGGGTNWTQGCIAIENDKMDELWPLIKVGTPVLTEY